MNVLTSEAERLEICLYFWTGIRKRELFALTWEDFDEENERLTLSKNKQYVAIVGILVCTAKKIIQEKSIVSLYPNGKSQTQLSKEYKISLSAINKWGKRYFEIKTEDGELFTAAHIKELQKRLPYSRHTQATIRLSS